MNASQKKKLVIATIALVVIAALAFCCATYLSDAGEDENFDTPDTPTLASNEPLKSYQKEYRAGGIDTEAFAVFAAVKEGSSTAIHFDGFFASGKHISELSGQSCDIHSASTTQTASGYSVHTADGDLIFIEDTAGLRVDSDASSDRALSAGCLSGVSWADMPIFTSGDIKAISTEEYHDILVRG